MNACTMQASALDRTRGPVGLSGTVTETRVLHPRMTGELVPLEIVFACNGIRCRVTQVFDSLPAAKEVQRTLPAGSHVTVFGDAPDLYMTGGELHLVAKKMITYQLTSDFTQRNLFSEVK